MGFKKKFHYSQNFYAYFFLLSIFLSFTIINYTGNVHNLYSAYLIKLFDVNINSDSFSNDFLLNNSFIASNFNFFTVLDFFNINLNNDYIGILNYSLLCLISNYFIFKIIKQNITLPNDKFILIVLPLFFSLNNVLLASCFSGSFYDYSSNQSVFGHTLIFIIFFFIISNKFVISFLLSILLFFVSVKMFWFPFLVIFSYFLIIKKIISTNKIYLLFIAFFILFFICSYFISPYSYDEKLFLINVAIMREQQEGFLFLQENIYKVIFSISLFISCFSLKYIKNEINPNLYILWKLTLFFTIFFVIFNLFFYFNYDLFPNYFFSYLSISRALGFYQFLFFLIFLIFLKNKNTFLIYFSSIIFFLILVSSEHYYSELFRLSTYLNENYLLLIFYVLIFCVFLILFFAYKKFRLFLQRNYFNLVFFIYLIIVIFSGNINTSIDRKFNKFLFFSDHRFFSQTGSIYYTSDALSLRKFNDFKMISIDENYNLLPEIVSLSYKSSYLGDFYHGYFHPDVLTEYFRREDLYNNFKHSCETKRIHCRLDVLNLLNEDVFLLIPDRFFTFYTGILEKDLNIQFHKIEKGFLIFKNYD